MKIKFTNVGKVGNAVIDLSGLSVIAGANDSGKSTIGKTIFALIKALNTTKEIYFKEASNKALKSLFSVFITLRRSQAKSILGNNEELFDPKLFLDEIQAVIRFNIPISVVIDRRRKILQRCTISEREKIQIFKKLAYIESLFNSSISQKEIISEAVMRFMESEFNSQINNVIGKKQSIIEIFIDNKNFYSFTFENNQLVKVEYPQDIKFTVTEIKDVTFIESPAFLSLIDVLRDLESYGSESDLWNANVGPLHLKDFATKILNLRFPTKKPFVNWSKKIEKIISGKFIFDEKKKGLYFRKKNKENSADVDPVNTAIGVRSFGILDILNQIGAINQTSMLIIDEPETHLHPEWQLKYAQLLIELVSTGAPVLVTSHSPYMIQALRFFAKEEDIYEKTHFYLSKPTKGSLYCQLNDLHGNLEEVFKTLAGPMHYLMVGK